MLEETEDDCFHVVHVDENEQEWGFHTDSTEDDDDLDDDDLDTEYNECDFGEED